MPGKPNKVGCAEFRQEMHLNRRGFIRAGMLGSTGLLRRDTIVLPPPLGYS
jgi:hypothetical protein